jgi:ABC-type arginine transport system ATPase subunit
MANFVFERTEIKEMENAVNDMNKHKGMVYKFQNIQDHNIAADNLHSAASQLIGMYKKSAVIVEVKV